MPLLIKSVSGDILNNLKTDIEFVKHVEGDFGYGDWFKVGHLEVFLQNLKKVVKSEVLLTPNKHGLTGSTNKPRITLEISY